ncbi:MAG: glucose-1-phosphate cytidylyltransferase [Pseudomonadota bacterium]|nr:glucose-1-phosphate cytidylyltransferase [Pseudomonadota bacterium]|tara:strand:+ start:168 stop:929 length:762 start_codon:yes stop_codon:yes gene_type:complete
MKVIILAGGLGTRLSEYTNIIPKPMVTIGGKPMLWHIMKTYAHFNHKDFYIALGYKAELIKDYFLNYRALNADFTVDLSSGDITSHQVESEDWRVTLVNTGEDSMTGGRVKRMQSYIGNEPFLLTYGDGVADIDLKELVAFHKNHGKMITVSAVRPSARFGELNLDGNKVSSFQEKPQLHEGWINGGYFVINPEFFDLINGDSTMLEREPLEQATNAGELMAYRHDGFWHCMDTKRDHELLESLWEKGAPWAV